MKYISPNLSFDFVRTLLLSSMFGSVQSSINLNNLKSSFTAHFNVPLNNNIFISQPTINSVSYNPTNQGYENTIDPNLVPTYTLDVVGLWTFNNYSSGISPDSSPGNALNGGPQAAVNHGTTYLHHGGRFGGAFQFNGNDYLEINSGPLSQSAPITTGYSMSVWIKIQTFTSSQKVWERMYDNIDLYFDERQINCMTRMTLGGYFLASYTWGSNKNLYLNTWTYAGCSFIAGNNTLSLWLNGTLAAYTILPSDIMGGGFQHGGFMPIGLGDRAFTTTDNEGFVGVIDEFTIWSRPLTPREWFLLFQLNSSVVPYSGIGFSSTQLVNISSFDSINVNITTTDPQLDDNLQLSVSTDGGVTFCALKSGRKLSMLSQGNNPVCLFPAVSLVYKVLYIGNVCMQSILFNFATRSPSEWNYIPAVPIGLNLAGPSYYSTGWHFVNALQESGGDLFFANLARDPNDGYPIELNINHQGGPASFLALTNNPSQGEYPAGTYYVISEGVGTLELHFDTGNHWFDSPANYSVNIPNPGVGIQVVISSSELEDHVRDVKLIHSSHLNTHKTQPFHPLFMSEISPFGAYRFMDWMQTNNNNYGLWEHRPRPNTAFENSQSYITLPIISIVWYKPGSSFSGKYAALVTVNTTCQQAMLAGLPPILLTGQQVDISGTYAYANYTSDTGVAGSQSLNLAAWQTNIELVTDNSFLVRIDQYWWNRKYVITGFQDGNSSGFVTVTITHGTAIETILNLSNIQNKSPWLNIPTLATDDFVTKFATKVRDLLNPHLSAYIEYSNEIWNTEFHSNSYIFAMSNKLNLNSMFEYQSMRSLQIFKIFQDVFGIEAVKRRIFKVISSQAAGPGISDTLLRAAKNNTINPHNISFDGLAIAPYFGDSVGTYIMTNNLMSSLSVDDVVDLTRISVETETRAFTRANFAVTRNYGVSLLAYEIGQSLVGNGAYQNNHELTTLLEAANRNQRMEGLYDNMIRSWIQEGGELMCAFSSTGAYSKYGSWGYKEFQNQPLQYAPKYRSLSNAALRYHAFQSMTVSPATINPTVFPVAIATLIPSRKPTASYVPSSPKPSVSLTTISTATPTANPSCTMTRAPSGQSIRTASCLPSSKQSISPAFMPSATLSVSPNCHPVSFSLIPSKNPSALHTLKPSTAPTANPTANPSLLPTLKPSASPTIGPSNNPSVLPSSKPSTLPSTNPTAKPSMAPTLKPSIPPTIGPSKYPSVFPTTKPSKLPSANPTANPSFLPTMKPSLSPTVGPSKNPTVFPTSKPSILPSTNPSASPSFLPTVKPSLFPTISPSKTPSAFPTLKPSKVPSTTPTSNPSFLPTFKPSVPPTISPSKNPSVLPTLKPSISPTTTPTKRTSKFPSFNL